MDRLVGFLVYWLGAVFLMFLDGTFAWLLLDSTFHLGYLVWCFIAMFGFQVVRSAQVLHETHNNLTAKRKGAKL